MLMCGRQNVFNSNRGDRDALRKIGKTSPEYALKRLQDQPVFTVGLSGGALHARQLLLEPLANQLHLWGTHKQTTLT
jgi:hypothetical protein